MHGGKGGGKDAAGAEREITGHAQAALGFKIKVLWTGSKGVILVVVVRRGTNREFEEENTNDST